MNRLSLLSLLLIVGSSLQMFAQDTIVRNRLIINVRTNNDTALPDVSVVIDSYPKQISNREGILFIDDFDLSQTPEIIRAHRENYELSTWTLDNNLLIIFMREATVRTVQGLLVDINGIAMPNTQIDFTGVPQQYVITDHQGYYMLKIPIASAFEPKNMFQINGKKTHIESIDDDENTVSLNLKYQDSNYIIYTVSVIEKNNIPYAQKVVTIGGESYLTNENGQFRMSPFKNPDIVWSLMGREILKLDTIKASNEIIVTLAPYKKNILVPLAVDSDTIPISIGQEIIEDIQLLSSYYNREEQILNEHKAKIQEISFKLPTLTDVQDDEKKQLTDQIGLIEETMDRTTFAFEETKTAHQNFILKLQKRLIEKELTIQEIEEENKELVTNNRFNTQLFLTILTITIVLLVVVTWVMRKFRAKNKIIEKTRKQLVKAQELAKIGNMVYDSSNRRFSYSDNFFNTLQITDPQTIKNIKKQIGGKLPKEMIAAEDRSNVVKKWEEGMKNQSNINISFRSNTSDGREVFIDMITEFETNDYQQVASISSTFQDVSLKKENELRLLSAINEAQEANKTKEAFLATMSHEIRTPLNAIIGLTNGLISDEPTQKQAEHLNIIQVSSEHLLALLNDILDFSKIKAGKIQLEYRAFELAEAVKNTANAMMYSTQNKDLKLVLKLDEKLPKFVNSDKVRVNQVIINLMSNAVKFTNSGSITVGVSLIQSEGTKKLVRFSVKDSGIGIATENFKNIFESFEQESNATSRKYGGTGLGLSISKNLVELLGGKIGVNSQLDEGSEFYFSIPLEEVASISPTAIEPPERKQDLSNVKLLCVEDNEINQIVATQYFNVLNINATFASTGLEAIDLVTSQSFDLILMDIRLPDLTGYEVCRKIKQKLPDYTTPIIAFTAEFDMSMEAKFKESGIKGIINKPFKENDLYNIILKHVDLDRCNQ